MSEALEITIVNWKKYQHRADKYDSMSWFRLDNRIINHAVFDLPPTQFKAFIFLLGFVAQNAHKSGQITTTMRILCARSGLKQRTIRACLGRCSVLGILKFRTLSTALSDATLRNVTLHNVTTEKIDFKKVSDCPGEVKEKLSKAREGRMDWYKEDDLSN